MTFLTDRITLDIVGRGTGGYRLGLEFVWGTTSSGQSVKASLGSMRSGLRGGGKEADAVVKGAFLLGYRRWRWTRRYQTTTDWGEEVRLMSSSHGSRGGSVANEIMSGRRLARRRGDGATRRGDELREWGRAVLAWRGWWRAAVGARALEVRHQSVELPLSPMTHQYGQHKLRGSGRDYKGA